MSRKRLYDAVRNVFRDLPEEPPPRRRRLASIAHSVTHILAAPPTCASCWEPVPDRDRTHFSCRGCPAALCSPCLRGYAEAALSDRSLLPLHCTGDSCEAPIPIASVTHLLPTPAAEKLERFERERVASTNPTGPGAALDAAMVALVEERGWTRCPACGTAVERIAGCAHMTCACGGEFCYDCGAVWEGGPRCPAGCGLFPALDDVPDPQEPDAHGGGVGDVFEEVPAGPAPIDALNDEVFRGIADMRARLNALLARTEAFRQTFRDAPPAPAVALRMRIGQLLANAGGEDDDHPHHHPLMHPAIHPAMQPGPPRTTLSKMSLQTIVHPEPGVSVLTVSPWGRR